MSNLESGDRQTAPLNVESRQASERLLEATQGSSSRFQLAQADSHHIASLPDTKIENPTLSPTQIAKEVVRDGEHLYFSLMKYDSFKQAAKNGAESLNELVQDVNKSLDSSGSKANMFVEHVEGSSRFDIKVRRSGGDLDPAGMLVDLNPPKIDVAPPSGDRPVFTCPPPAEAANRGHHWQVAHPQC